MQRNAKTKIKTMNKGKKFDIILANPPFNLGVKMLTKWFDIANEICTVQPSTWLLGKQQAKDIVKYVDKWEYTEIESIQGSEHFDAAIGGTTAIQHFVKGNSNNLHYDKQERIKFDGKWYKECKEINKFSNDELLMEFFNKVSPDKLSDNLHLHIKREPETIDFVSCPIENNPNPNWWIYRTMVFSGHSTTHSKQIGEFYTLISRTMKYTDACGQYKNLKNKEEKFLKYYIPFNTENELKNFWNYIHTDFTRICLWFRKNTLQLARGELKYIPWFDFSDPIFSKSPSEIDDYLFKKYNISDEIRKYIEEILPDYYNIRHENSENEI